MIIQQNEEFGPCLITFMRSGYKKSFMHADYFREVAVVGAIMMELESSLLFFEIVLRALVTDIFATY